jgi:hypothetical protein
MGDDESLPHPHLPQFFRTMRSEEKLHKQLLTELKSYKKEKGIK